MWLEYLRYKDRVPPWLLEKINGEGKVGDKMKNCPQFLKDYFLKYLRYGVKKGKELGS